MSWTPDSFRRCLILTGPTGSGKSALALAHAPRLNAEIVCMDSMTLYRGMDIGTAKPSAADRAAVPHHLVDVLDPSESASVAWWLTRAAQAVADIEARGKQALLVGGTALYLKAVLHGLMEAPSADEALRQQLEQEAALHGVEVLHGRLARVDPQAAQRIHPNNIRRVIRALEVYQLTGQPLSHLQSQWNRPILDEGRILCLTLPRETLYARINARVDAMIAAGLLDEVRRLRERPISREASQALGYKELFAYLDGKVSLEVAIEQIRTRSRQFAKRQLTWFRQLQGCRMVENVLTQGPWASRMELL
ncbi:MAG: tRNA (adenosine(37)-N6)-dimethylallyltransferase MiaA [Gemmataceae bacterium]